MLLSYFLEDQTFLPYIDDQMCSIAVTHRQQIQKHCVKFKYAKSASSPLCANMAKKKKGPTLQKSSFYVCSQCTRHSFHVYWKHSTVCWHQQMWKDNKYRQGTLMRVWHLGPLLSLSVSIKSNQLNVRHILHFQQCWVQSWLKIYNWFF